MTQSKRRQIAIDDYNGSGGDDILFYRLRCQIRKHLRAGTGGDQN